VIDECDVALGGGLKDIMFEGSQVNSDFVFQLNQQEVLTNTVNAQPAILCHSIALLRVLENDFGFNVNDCSYAIGHSLGE
jgi:[acyl-carrier-protein] S-malonyltransferase